MMTRKQFLGGFIAGLAGLGAMASGKVRWVGKRSTDKMSTITSGYVRVDDVTAYVDVDGNQWQNLDSFMTEPTVIGDPISKSSHPQWRGSTKRTPDGGMMFKMEDL